jgi:hypothetical protein
MNSKQLVYNRECTDLKGQGNIYVKAADNAYYCTRIHTHASTFSALHWQTESCQNRRKKGHEPRSVPQ